MSLPSDASKQEFLKQREMRRELGKPPPLFEGFVQPRPAVFQNQLPFWVSTRAQCPVQARSTGYEASVRTERALRLCS